MQYMVIMLVGLSWLMVNYVKYGQHFIKAHIQDQLIKRINVPIELHFGGRLFYPEFIWKEFSFVLVIIVLAYFFMVWDVWKKIKIQGKQFFQSRDFQYYLILCAAIPFFTLLTLAKSKLWWYLILIVPLISLVIPYFLMRIEHVKVQNAILIGLCAFFLYRFIPATYALKPVVEVPDKLRVAQCISALADNEVLFMVNDQERKNRNVVEAAQLQTSSSFMFGGSPAFVHYVNKKTLYFYRVGDLLQRLNGSGILVISREDMARQEFTEVRLRVSDYIPETRCFFGEWEAFTIK